ncbi:unnamed protein product, partial [Symbiodinium sp. CCMP2456]
DVPLPTEILGEEELESEEEFAGPEDVPHPMEIDKEEALAELGPDDGQIDPLEIQLREEMLKAESGDLTGPA